MVSGNDGQEVSWGEALDKLSVDSFIAIDQKVKGILEGILRVLKNKRNADEITISDIKIIEKLLQRLQNYIKHGYGIENDIEADKVNIATTNDSITSFLDSLDAVLRKIRGDTSDKKMRKKIDQLKQLIDDIFFTLLEEKMFIDESFVMFLEELSKYRGALKPIDVDGTKHTEELLNARIKNLENHFETMGKIVKTMYMTEKTIKIYNTCSTVLKMEKRTTNALNFINKMLTSIESILNRVSQGGQNYSGLRNQQIFYILNQFKELVVSLSKTVSLSSFVNYAWLIYTHKMQEYSFYKIKNQPNISQINEILKTVEIEIAHSKASADKVIEELRNANTHNLIGKTKEEREVIGNIYNIASKLEEIAERIDKYCEPAINGLRQDIGISDITKFPLLEIVKGHCKETKQSIISALEYIKKIASSENIETNENEEYASSSTGNQDLDMYGALESGDGVIHESENEAGMENGEIEEPAVEEEEYRMHANAEANHKHKETLQAYENLKEIYDGMKSLQGNTIGLADYIASNAGRIIDAMREGGEAIKHGHEWGLDRNYANAIESLMVSIYEAVKGIAERLAGMDNAVAERYGTGVLAVESELFKILHNAGLAGKRYGERKGRAKGILEKIGLADSGYVERKRRLVEKWRNDIAGLERIWEEYDGKAGESLDNDIIFAKDRISEFEEMLERMEKMLAEGEGEEYENLVPRLDAMEEEIEKLVRGMIERARKELENNGIGEEEFTRVFKRHGRIRAGLGSAGRKIVPAAKKAAGGVYKAGSWAWKVGKGIAKKPMGWVAGGIETAADYLTNPLSAFGRSLSALGERLATIIYIAISVYIIYALKGMFQQYAGGSEIFPFGFNATFIAIYLLVAIEMIQWDASYHIRKLRHAVREKASAVKEIIYVPVSAGAGGVRKLAGKMKRKKDAAENPEELISKARKRIEKLGETEGGEEEDESDAANDDDSNDEEGKEEEKDEEGAEE